MGQINEIGHLDLASRIVDILMKAKATWNYHTKCKSFIRKSQNPMKVQWQFLKKLLQEHQDTEFGKQYGFASMKCMEDFRSRVPIHNWEDIAPYIEKVRNGNTQALFPVDEKILMYAGTSGTTGTPKFIPVTRTSYFYYGYYWDHTLGFVHGKSRAGIKAGRALIFPGDAEEGYFGDIPFGAISARVYSQQPSIAKLMYPYPYEIAKIKDYNVLYYTIMRMAIETTVTSIPVANPSTIITLLRTAQERAKDIIYDIRHGNLRYQNKIPKNIRNELLKKILPNPKLADKLESVYSETGKFLPRQYWGTNRISVICFASGPLRLYLEQLENYLDNFYITDLGLLASEGRLSFPIDNTNNIKGCCLTLESNFFEFIPEDQIDLANPQVFTLSELEKGKRYFIIFTNYSGLYRYNISDLFEITGYYNKTPLIYFCNKGKHFSNITGEKVSEFQITESVYRAGKRVGINLENFIACLHWDIGRPSYSILTGEMSGGESHAISNLYKLIDPIEEELMHLNIEYHAKRQSNRLGPLTLKIIEGAGFDRFESRRKSEIRSISQYKQVFLCNDPNFEMQFKFKQEFCSSIDPQSISPLHSTAMP